MRTAKATVVIAARNAAPTIGRAVASALDPVVGEILVVDDHSSDNTSEVARQSGDSRLRVIESPCHQSLGLVRQTALEAVRTPFAVNLDADDAFLPGRVARLVATMETTGADVAADALELCDGATGTKIRDVPLPPFLNEPGSAVRNFERNYLPGVGQIAYRTAFASGVGYDPELHGVEDTDFFLRAVAAGAHVAFVSEIGYRMYSYPGSVSRNLALQRQMLARLLRKHDYSAVRRLYLAAGYDPRIADWGLCSMALFREEPAVALAFLEKACPPGADLRLVLEPDGPLPVPEGWRLGFFRGTLCCLLGRPAEALADFAAAAEHPLTDLVAAGGIAGAPDLLNNWGVALAATGRAAEARAKFEAALSLFPGYLDARLNLAAERPAHLTSHPLRRQPSRREY